MLEWFEIRKLLINGDYDLPFETMLEYYNEAYLKRKCGTQDINDIKFCYDFNIDGETQNVE